MGTSITVRDIDPGDKSWLRREARQVGVSMEELVRRLIMEDERRRGEPLDDHVPDAFLAAVAATRGLAVVTRNTGEFRNTGVETVDPWTGGPR